MSGIVIPVFVAFILVPFLAIHRYWKKARIKYWDLDKCRGFMNYNILRISKEPGLFKWTIKRNGKDWNIIAHKQNVDKEGWTYYILNLVSVTEDPINREIILESDQMEISRDRQILERCEQLEMQKASLIAENIKTYSRHEYEDIIRGREGKNIELQPTQ